MRNGLAMGMSLLAVSACWAQEHPYSNAYAYYTTAITPNLEFTATTYASTGGTSTHLMNQIAVFIQSPAARTASAYEYPGWPSGQATAYLPLCFGSSCEDGSFYVSTVNTTELCGVTQQVLSLAVQEGPNQVQPWVKWTDATMNPTSIPRADGESTFTGHLQKSNHCTGVDSISLALWKDPMNIDGLYWPNSSQPATFAGNAGSVQWTVKTGRNNTHSGRMTAAGGIEVTACTIQQGPGSKVVEVRVQ